MQTVQNIQGLGGEATSSRKVLRMETRERTAGSMPVWGRADTPKAAAQARLSSLQGTQGARGQDFDALAYRASLGAEQEAEEFGFADLLDMVNPLQHLPLVNYAYRELTGDTIKPSAQIIGGAVFGGPLGAAGGLVNAVIAEETGKDIGENAMGLVMRGEKPQFRDFSVEDGSSQDILAEEVLEAEIVQWDDPAGDAPVDSDVVGSEEVLAFEVRKLPVVDARDSLPGTVLAMADLSSGGVRGVARANYVAPGRSSYNS